MKSKGFLASARKWALGAALLCAGAMTSAAYGADQYLIVHKSDGGTTSYVLSDTPKVTFDASTMHITGAEFSDDYAIAEVAKFTFSDTSGIGEVAKDESRVSLLDNTLTLEGWTPGAQVSVCDLQGRVAKQSAISGEGAASIELGGLAPGVYIVSISTGKSFKIIVK